MENSGNDIFKPLKLKKFSEVACPQTPSFWSAFGGLTFLPMLTPSNFTLRPCYSGSSCDLRNFSVLKGYQCLMAIMGLIHTRE